jgi:hypothetical protein
MTLSLPRRIYAATVGDLVSLALAQPHQAMLSTGSVAIMAQFAAHSGIVDPLVGYCIAIGVEWAYLRGLASAAKVTTRWASVLNWSAFGVVVLWGVLWVATVYGALPEKPQGGAAFWLAVAHVVPVAWLSLCSAMCHQASASREAREAEDDRRWRKELERKAEERRLEVDTRAYARQHLASAPAVRAPSAAQPSPASGRDLDARVTALVDALRADASLTENKAEWARRIGVSRTAIYPIIKEAQARGLLRDKP